MAALTSRRITAEERATWERDGVVCLRGVYRPQVITDLLASWDNMVAEPSAYGLGPRSVEQPALGSGTYVVPRARFCLLFYHGRSKRRRNSYFLFNFEFIVRSTCFGIV